MFTFKMNKAHFFYRVSRAMCVSRARAVGSLLSSSVCLLRVLRVLRVKGKICVLVHAEISNLPLVSVVPVPFKRWNLFHKKMRWYGSGILYLISVCPHFRGPSKRRQLYVKKTTSITIAVTGLNKGYRN